MGIFSILFSSIGSLIWGVLLTVVGIALMFLIIKSWRKDAYFTPISYIVGIVLFFFLSFQAILMCGAITIKSCSDEIRAYINRMVDNLPEDVVFSTSDSQQILDNINEEYPIVANYFDWADFKGHTPVDIADSMVEVFNENLNWYIARRVGWSILFVVIGAVVVIKTMDKFGGTVKKAPTTNRYVYDD